MKFIDYADVRKVAARGLSRSTVILRSGLQIDLRVVAENSYGAALAYFTGSKVHNIAIRRLGQERGLKINEYGVFRGNERIAGTTEEQVYAAVGLRWIPPELRENAGKIEAAHRRGRPPRQEGDVDLAPRRPRRAPRRPEGAARCEEHGRRER